LSDVRTGFVEVPGARLWYDDRGAGPAVLFTHAAIADHRMWEPQLAPFASSGRRVVRWDVRTFGSTTNDATPFSSRADIVALLDHLGLERAALVGCSMGGSVSLSFTVEHPERVAALVLAGAGVGGLDPPDAPAEAALAAQGEAAVAARDWTTAADIDVRLWVDGVGQSPERVAAAVRELVRGMNLEHYAAEPPEPEHLALEPPAGGRLAEVTTPTLVMVGDLDAQRCQISADYLMAGIAGARRHVFRNAAHLPNLEHPAEFNEVVLRFLSESGA
jgi:pimeloyl-ACP methyl ester carboxylesterase